MIIIVKLKRSYGVWNSCLREITYSFPCLTDPPELPKPCFEGEDIHLFMPPVWHREGGCSTHHRHLPSSWRHTRQGLLCHCLYCMAHTFRCHAELPWWSVVPHHDLFRLAYSCKFLTLKIVYIILRPGFFCVTCLWLFSGACMFCLDNNNDEDTSIGGNRHDWCDGCV